MVSHRLGEKLTTGDRLKRVRCNAGRAGVVVVIVIVERGKDCDCDCDCGCDCNFNRKRKGAVIMIIL